MSDRTINKLRIMSIITGLGCVIGVAVGLIEIYDRFLISKEDMKIPSFKGDVGHGPKGLEFIEFLYDHQNESVFIDAWFSVEDFENQLNYGYEQELEKIRGEGKPSGLSGREGISELVLAHGALSGELNKLYASGMEHNDGCDERLGSCKFALDISQESLKSGSAFDWSSGGYRLRGYFVIDYHGYIRQGVTNIDLTSIAKIDAIKAVR